MSFHDDARHDEVKQFIRAPSSNRAAGSSFAGAVRASFSSYDRDVLTRFGRRELNPPTTVMLDLLVRGGFCYLKGDSPGFVSWLNANNVERVDLANVFFTVDFEYPTWG